MTDQTPAPGNAPGLPAKALQDLMTDSTMLVGLVEAVSILVHEADGGQHPRAGNALHALLPEVERKADELASAIEQFDRDWRKS